MRIGIACPGQKRRLLASNQDVWLAQAQASSESLLMGRGSRVWAQRWRHRV